MQSQRLLSRQLLHLSQRRISAVPLVLQTRLSSSTSESGQDVLASIRSALKESMRAKDQFRSGVLKSSLGEIQTASYAPEGETAPSPSKTLSKSIKKRQEAIETFLQSGRQDLAAQYKDEVSILSSFVAQQTTLTSEQIDQLVQSTFAKLQLDKNDKQAMGKLIKAARDATPDVDGKALAASVKRFLTGP